MSFLSLKHGPETTYQHLSRVIENANFIIFIYQNIDAFGDLQVYLDSVTVAFGSALHNQGLTLTTLKKMKILKNQN